MRIMLIGLAALAVLAIIIVPTCFVGPYQKEIGEKIGTNETAFLIMRQGDTKSGQAKFESQEFLDERKVATKEVIIPQRIKRTGRLPASFEWVRAADLIKISRTPVQREWTDDAGTGTSTRVQKLYVESQDSVGFGVGATMMAHIEPTDAATFVYYFQGQQLEEIIDGPIRGFALSILSEKFGSLDLEQCKMTKGQVFTDTRKAVIAKFTTFGITIDFFGSSEGLTYENADIQQAIDQQVVSEARIVERENNKLANDKDRADRLAESTNLVQVAEQQALAAQKLADKKDAMAFEVELFERRQRALALPQLAANFNNIKILPSNSPLLLELGLTDK